MMDMHDSHTGASAIKEEDQAVCPVMNMPVSKRDAAANGLIRVYQGKEYYLCRNGCIGSFEAQPKEYAIGQGAS